MVYVQNFYLLIRAQFTLLHVQNVKIVHKYLSINTCIDAQERALLDLKQQEEKNKLLTKDIEHYREIINQLK